MKKLSLVAAAMILFAGVSFAQSTTPAPAKKDAKAKTEKKGGKMDKKGGKMDKKAATPAAK